MNALIVIWSEGLEVFLENKTGFVLDKKRFSAEELEAFLDERQVDEVYVLDFSLAENQSVK